MRWMHTQQNCIRYIFLSVLGMLGSSSTILADTFFVANRLGAQGLAALNIVIAVFGIINGIGIMFGLGGAIQYTIHRAQEHHDRANQTFTLAFLAALGCGLLLFFIGIFKSQSLAVFLGANPSILPMCNIYLKTVLIFAPFFILNHLFMAFIRNDHSPRLSTAAMLIGSIANILLDYLFLYPLNMGILGAALATGLSPVIGLSVCAFHHLCKQNQFHFTVSTPCLAELKVLSSLGASAFLNEISSSIVLVIFNLLVFHYAGNIGLAAYGIIANLALVVLAVFTGISLGLQPLVSHAHGQNDAAEIRVLRHNGLLLSNSIGILVFLSICFFAPTMVSWFNSAQDTSLQLIAEDGMRLYFAGFLFVGHNFLTASICSATEQPKASFLLSFFRGCIGIVLAALAFSICFGLKGIWISFPVVELVALGLGHYLTHTEKRLTKTPYRTAAKSQKSV